MPKIKRLTCEEYVCYLALAASARSEDPFRRVGAALLDKSGGTVGTATNGLKAGMEVPEWMFNKENRDKKSKYFIHAESNLFARYKNQGYYLGLTISPCFECAKQIVVNNISIVTYINKYKGIEEVEELFRFYGINMIQLTKKQKQNICDFMIEDIDLLCPERFV